MMWVFVFLFNVVCFLIFCVFYIQGTSGALERREVADLNRAYHGEAEQQIETGGAGGPQTEYGIFRYDKLPEVTKLCQN